jgi:hypothetical protein
MLAAPALWSGWSIATPVSNSLPAAGPNGNLLAAMIAAAPKPPPRSASGAETGENATQAARPPGFDDYQPPDPALVDFLERNHAGERYLLATATTLSASPLIIDRTMPVAALGGFVGQDPIVDPRELARMVADGDLRFVLAPDPRKVNLLATMTGAWSALTGADAENPASGDSSGDADRPDPSQFLRMFMTPNIRWVGQNCEPVPAGEWQTPGKAAANPLAGLDILYDCAEQKDRQPEG